METQQHNEIEIGHRDSAVIHKITSGHDSTFIGTQVGYSSGPNDDFVKGTKKKKKKDIK